MNDIAVQKPPLSAKAGRGKVRMAESVEWLLDRLLLRARRAKADLESWRMASALRNF